MRCLRRDEPQLAEMITDITGAAQIYTCCSSGRGFLRGSSLYKARKQRDRLLPPFPPHTLIQPGREVSICSVKCSSSKVAASLCTTLLQLLQVCRIEGFHTRGFHRAASVPRALLRQSHSFQGRGYGEQKPGQPVVISHCLCLHYYFPPGSGISYIEWI